MKSTVYKIYVGLNDADTRAQEHSTENYMHIIRNICRGYRTAFSISFLNGGYYHDDGSFVDENALCLTLIGTDSEAADEIAKDICAFFRQESVLVTEDIVECRFIRNSIE